MKQGILVLAMLALAASAWAFTATIGGLETLQNSQQHSGGAIPTTDTLYYNSALHDLSVYYINPPRLFGATRFTPPYTGTIDSCTLFLRIHPAQTTPEDTLFFYKDTLSPKQPGRATNAYRYSLTVPNPGTYFFKLSLTTPFAITNGLDFWAGTRGLVDTTHVDSLWMIMDTTHSWKNNSTDREFVSLDRTTWTEDSLASLPYNWAIYLYANTASGVELLTSGGSVSLSPKLYPASPNPFRGAGELAFDLPKQARVEFAIHDLSGRLVRTLAESDMSAGHHALRWDGKDALGQPVASGVYLYTLRAGNLSATRTLVIVR